MKVLIITWMKYNNFGTVLQAYALQKKITKLGYDVKTLDDHGIGFDLIDEKIYNKAFKIIKRKTNTLIKIIFKKKDTSNVKENLFDKFKNDYIKIDYNSLDKRRLNNEYQVFVTGSDQIWSPSKYIFSKFYYLDFVDKLNSKISYAPSIGKGKYTSKLKRIIKPLLDNFEYISVREEKAQKILKDLFNIDSSLVSDPTLLLTKEDYKEVIAKRFIKEDYTLCYFLSNNDWYFKYLEKYKKENLVILKDNTIFYNNVKIDIGPKEFLSLIYYSNKVITDSYHGTLFSLIFEKEFITLKRFKSTKNNKQNSRLEHLFNLINVDDRFIDEDNFIYSFKKLDYKNINSYLNKYIENSSNYLSNALKNCRANNLVTGYCTSCMACYNNCPKDAIEMKLDSYGELKAVKNKEKCISCGLCEKVCQNNVDIKYNMPFICYGAKTLDEGNKKSTSGGVAYKLSKQVLLNNGVVYGCVVENTKVIHKRITNINDLEKTQGSKYTQSYIGNTYKQLLEDLKNNKQVLFIGSPCEASALKLFLGKDYDNLIIVDLACHGNVPQKNLEDYISKYKNIGNIKFRNKHEYKLSLYDKDNKTIYENNNDSYLYCFLKDISLKEVCHICKYATQKRVGDITLGDFWKIKDDHLSLVAINTEKGQELFDSLENIYKKEYDYMDTIEGNDSYNHPQGKPFTRYIFNNGLFNSNINNAIKKSKISLKKNNLKKL